MSESDIGCVELRPRKSKVAPFMKKVGLQQVTRLSFLWIVAVAVLAGNPEETVVECLENELEVFAMDVEIEFGIGRRNIDEVDVL